MKKVYVNPVIIVLNLELANLCGASDMHSDETLGASQALSREGGSFFDDDED